GFLVEAMAKQTVRAGGIGLADQVVAQMVKMQEQGQ
ncbi:MAG: rod-binding protein, partial [Brevundimonas sp.]|nr:rod-binding protein [Brevundimonas sp.]